MSTLTPHQGSDARATCPNLTNGDVINLLINTGREFYRRGWVLGTSGNFSATTSDAPLRLIITASGLDKGSLFPDNFVEIDHDAKVVMGESRPSAEAALHLAIVRQVRAGAVFHTHSVWSTLLSDFYATAGGVNLVGHEMLKGLARVSTHEHSEWVPILQNSQDYGALSAEVSDQLKRFPKSHGILLRKHGLYTWGKDILEARRHVEIFEFLFEIVGRQRLAGIL